MRGFDVVEELTESASAKDPGRPVFRQLMKRVRDGRFTASSSGAWTGSPGTWSTAARYLLPVERRPQ
jgi:hypothetical protein